MIIICKVEVKPTFDMIDLTRDGLLRVNLNGEYLASPREYRERYSIHVHTRVFHLDS